MMKTLFLAAVALAVLGAAPLVGQDAPAGLVRSLQACRAIESSLARLDCYDQLVGSMATLVSPDDSPSTSAGVAVALSRKGLREVDYQDYITLELIVSNLLAKDVRALTGVITFTDLFDRPIMQNNLTIEEEIEAGGFVAWEGSIEYNQFISEHVRLATIDHADLKVRFELAEVIYTDGTRERFGGPG